MKKIYAAFILMTLITQAFAQETGGDSYFGVKAGVNFASNSIKNPSLSDVDVKSKPGFAGGLYYNIGLSEMFSIQPELLYSAMGSNLEPVNSDGSGNATLNINYVAIPLLFKVSPIWRVGIFAGPQFNFLANSKLDYDSGDDVDQSDRIKGFDFAGTIGAEFWITRHVGVYGRYVAGFSDINQKNPGIWYNDNAITGDVKNSAFQVGLTVGFRSGNEEPAPAKSTSAEFKDADGDGIADDADKCPKTAGIASNLGCPEMILYYSRDETTLGDDDMNQLDEVVKFLKKNPDLNVIVEGHTSALGESDYNQTLSEKRANASADYMVSKGIDRNRVKVVGYGEQFLVGDNDTEEGKSKSRRVVIKIAQ